MSETPEAPWGADGPISTPEPLATRDVQMVSFGGLAFTPMGLVFDLTEVDREEHYAPRYGPEGDDGAPA